MFYREAGQFRTSYAQDAQIFPLRQDRIGIALLLLAAVLLPFVTNNYWLSAILIPWLVLSLVNGTRFQPAQRSRSDIPASRAIRSSSAGQT